MAQTRKKRQTKHRGNAAGVVESRGRTGRKPTTAEKSGTATPSAAARKREVDRRDRPPTWKSAFYKAMVATVLLLFVVLVFMKGSAGAIGLFPIVLGAYTVVSYYTDKWVYERRQRKKAREGKAKAQGAKGQKR